MIVVSDTSPITNLAAIRHLDLLPGLFGSVSIPEAVARELAACPNGSLGFVDIARCEWLSARPIAQCSVATALSLELDAGEAEAIALALEMKARLILVDEHRARRTAQRLGLSTLGVLGILVKAKRDGLVQQVKPLLDALISEAGFWIRTDLRSRVLSEVSED